MRWRKKCQDLPARRTRHGCLLEAEGPSRTASSAGAAGPAVSLLSGAPNWPSKKSDSQGRRPEIRLAVPARAAGSSSMTPILITAGMRSSVPVCMRRKKLSG